VLVFALTRGEIANYVQALFYVYILIIFVYILLNLMFSLGLRKPYSRVLDGFMTFLRDVSDPYLRLFRRFVPTVGMFDFSPIVAIVVLYVLQYVIYNAIAG
jgi:YggT family protein